MAVDSSRDVQAVEKILLEMGGVRRDIQPVDPAHLLRVEVPESGAPERGAG